MLLSIINRLSSIFLLLFCIFFACKDVKPNALGKKIILICETENGAKTFELSSDVTELDLYDAGITHLSTTIGQLKNLTAVNLKGNQLANLPIEITELENLETLSLSSNLLTSLPNEINRLKNLKNLSLDRGNFSNAEQIKIVSLLPHCNINFESDDEDGD